MQKIDLDPVSCDEPKILVQVSVHAPISHFGMHKSNKRIGVQKLRLDFHSNSVRKPLQVVFTHPLSLEILIDLFVSHS